MASKEKGMTIFLDVFRRADKNDDGALSWDEFKAFFADGVLSEEELKNLFNEIDTHNTNNIDTGELCEYFSKSLGPFKDLFSVIEEMNGSVSQTLIQSAQTYPQASFTEQFMTRFLLREIINQLVAVQKPLDAASDHLDEQAQQERGTQSAASIDEVSGKRTVDPSEGVPIHGSFIPGRFARRAKNQFSTQTSWPEPGAGAGPLAQQVDRLRSLVDKLENKVNFNGIAEEQLNIGEEELMLIVHRKMKVHENHDKAFRTSLRNYVEGSNAADGCLHLTVRTYAESPWFVVYEIWDSEESWKEHLCKGVYKTFMRNNIDYLEIPEQLKTLPVPRSWWKSE